MKNRTKTAFGILQAAALLGVLGDLLLRQTPWGLNAFIWFGLLSMAMVTITLHHNPENLTPRSCALDAALIFFGFTFLWRDSFALGAFNLLAIGAILSAKILPALNISHRAAGIIHYIAAAIIGVVNAAAGPFLLALEDVKWSGVPKKGLVSHLGSIAKGLLIVIPILFLFGKLFMEADAAFESFVTNTFFEIPDDLRDHLIIFGFVTWMVAGYLRASIFGISFRSLDPGKYENRAVSILREKPAASGLSFKKTENKKIPKIYLEKRDWRNFDNSILPESYRLGTIEIGIILGLVNLLFLGFVIIQISYLFGGLDFVQNTADFKLSEYARRGFWELSAVSAMVLPLLLASHWLLNDEKSVTLKIYRGLAGVQIGLLFIIMISAVQRLLLLSGESGYGLTALRLYPIVFIILLAMIFLWFAITVLRGMREQFAWGALWCGLFVLATLHVLNPDDFIVRTNLKLMEQGRGFDISYNASLSDDALPALISSIPKIDAQDNAKLIKKLSFRYCAAQKENDLRSWNLSREKARALFESVLVIPVTDCNENLSDDF